MKYKFSPKEDVIVVSARIVGPKSEVTLKLALDTGASSTMIPQYALKLLGYDSTHQTCEVEMITGSGTEIVPKVKLRQIDSLGKRRRGLEIIAHTLPKGASVDGLLGLDFFRRMKLTINFRNHVVKLD